MVLVGLVLVQMGNVRILRLRPSRNNFHRIQILLRTDGLVGMQMTMVEPILRIVSPVNSVWLLLTLFRLVLRWYLLRQRISILLLSVHHNRAVVRHHSGAICIHCFRWIFRRVVRHSSTLFDPAVKRDKRHRTDLKILPSTKASRWCW